MIGLAGAHRTGKTTLAKQYAENIDIPFVETSTSAVFKALGFDPKVDYDFKIRMNIQNRILDAATALWSKYKGLFITDRTPLDMIAYTMADIQRENLDSDDQAMFLDYQDRCFKALNRHFTMAVVVQPGIPLVYEEGKAPLNKAYIEHLNTLAIGLINDRRVEATRFVMSRKITDLSARCETLDLMLQRTYQKHDKAIHEQSETQRFYLH